MTSKKQNAPVSRTGALPSGSDEILRQGDYSTPTADAQSPEDQVNIEKLIEAAQVEDKDNRAFDEIARSNLRFAPELPKYAQLPDHLLANMDKVGLWQNEYVKFASKASPMTALAFHEVLGLVIQSTTIARRVAIKVSATEIFPNLYALLIAPSTQYRKSTAFKIARDLLKIAGLRFLLLPGRMTPESMATELSGNKPATFDNWDEEAKSDWTKERLFAAQRAWLMEEAGSLFFSFEQKYTAGLLNTVLDFYECPEDPPAYFTQSRGRETVRRVYLNICGPTTPSQISSFLSNPLYFDNGLWARFILVTPDTPPVWEFWSREELAIPANLVDPIRKLALEKLPMPRRQEGGSGIIAPAVLRPILEKGVWERWTSYAQGLEAEIVNRDKVKAKYFSAYGRYHTTAIKIAQSLAVSDWAIDGVGQTPKVTLLHWARAQSYVENFRESLHRLLENPIRHKDEENLEDKISRWLPSDESGDSLPLRNLQQKLNMSSPDERRSLLGWLEQMMSDGLVKTRPSKTFPKAKASQCFYKA